MFKTSITSVVVLAAISAASAQPTVVKQQSVLRLNIGCPGNKARYQTAFRVAGVDGLVTALHGLIGCSRFSAAIPGTAVAIKSLSLSYVNVEYDFAILASKEISAAWPPPLKLGTMTPKMSSVGFPFGIDQSIEIPMDLRNPTTAKLFTLIPDQDIRMFTLRASPQVKVEVLNLSGHLTSGDSGGPVLNSRGEVVGMADGGLEKGAVEISWAIDLSFILAERRWDPVALRQDELKRLERDPSQLLLEYDAEVILSTAPVTCFGRNLYPIRVATLTELAENADDKNAVRSYTAMFGVDDIARSFVIYRDAMSYLNIVIPSNWRLEARLSECFATSPAGHSIEYMLIPVSTTATANSTLELEEMNRVCGAVLDPMWSSSVPKYALQRGIVTGHKVYVNRQQRCAAANRLANDIITNWNTLPPPSRGGPLRCLPICQAPLVAYPDAFYGSNLFSFTLDAWNFVNYVFDSQNLLMAFTKYDDTIALRTLLDCTAMISFDASCRKAVENEREWAAGVVAATASTLAPR